MKFLKIIVENAENWNCPGGTLLLNRRDMSIFEYSPSKMAKDLYSKTIFEYFGVMAIQYIIKMFRNYQYL